MAGGPVAEFAHQLRALREAAGRPTYAEMAEKAHYSATSLSVAASGKKLPTWECAEAYIRSLGHNPKEYRRFWMAARAAVASRKGKGKKPTSDTKAELPGERLPVPTPWREPNLFATDKRPGSGSTPRYGPDPSRAILRSDLGPLLNELRLAKGLSYRDLERRSQQMPGGRWLSRSTLNEIMSGRRSVRRDEMIRIVAMCGGSAGEQVEWLTAYSQILEYERRAKDALRALGGESPTHEAPTRPERSKIEKGVLLAALVLAVLIAVTVTKIALAT